MLPDGIQEVGGWATLVSINQQPSKEHNQYNEELILLLTNTDHPFVLVLQNEGSRGKILVYPGRITD